MFLGTKCDIEQLQVDEKRNCSFNLIIYDNPLNDFVELPEHLQNMDYSNIICGVIKGAMATVLVSLFCAKTDSPAQAGIPLQIKIKKLEMEISHFRANLSSAR